jgi:hypothetical protein
MFQHRLRGLMRPAGPEGAREERAEAEHGYEPEPEPKASLPSPRQGPGHYQGATLCGSYTCSKSSFFGLESCCRYPKSLLGCRTCDVPAPSGALVDPDLPSYWLAAGDDRRRRSFSV